MTRANRLVSSLRTLRFLLLSIAGIVLILGGFFFINLKPIPFESSNWIQQEDERFRMVDDLIESGMLISKPKAEVRSILGIDYEECYQKSWCFNIPEPLDYAPFGSWELIVLFSDNDKVELVKQIHR